MFKFTSFDETEMAFVTLYTQALSLSYRLLALIDLVIVI